MGTSEVARFEEVHRGRLLAAALMGNLLPLAVATASGLNSHPAVFFVGAAGACLAPLVVVLVRRRHRVIFYGAAFGGLPCLAMLQAYAGGAASAYSVLILMPMIWFGLQATDRELIAGAVVLALCSFLPMLVFGPPAYPVDWGAATLLVIVGVAVSGSLRSLSRETQRLTNRLRREAVIDDLTGLLNRRGWEDAARRELGRARRGGVPVTAVTLDLDRLKELNDAWGHEEGDRVLRETGERLRRALRATDVVARLGGDEFAALLIESRLDDALGALGRLQDVTPPQGTFSAGVAVWNGGDEDLADLLRRADLALYEAKTDPAATTKVAAQAPDSPGPATIEADVVHHR